MSALCRVPVVETIVRVRSGTRLIKELTIELDDGASVPRLRIVGPCHIDPPELSIEIPIRFLFFAPPSDQAQVRVAVLGWFTDGGHFGPVHGAYPPNEPEWIDVDSGSEPVPGEQGIVVVPVPQQGAKEHTITVTVQSHTPVRSWSLYFDEGLGAPPLGQLVPTTIFPPFQRATSTFCFKLDPSQHTHVDLHGALEGGWGFWARHRFEGEPTDLEFQLDPAEPS
jgi:hypothetical protein